MFQELTARFGSRAKRDEPLSQHTTFRIGGPADALVDVESLDELRFLLDLARKKDVPLRLLGGGSNLLVREAGVRGIVVRLRGEFLNVAHPPSGEAVASYDVAHPPSGAAVSAPSAQPEAATLHSHPGAGVLHYAGAGAPLSAVCSEAVRRGFNNFCWTAGIPGTLGGAILGNAGAWGHNVGEFVESLRVMTRRGEEKTLRCFSPSPLGACPEALREREGRGEGVAFGYRRTVLPESGLIILGATLRLANVDAPHADAREVIRDYVERKRRTQPLEHPSAGSVFKNPAPEKPAGLLIDQAGCKGLRVEGACVSPKHANFIVNDRHAAAADVMHLIEQVRAAVKARSGVDLELEIQVW